MIDQRPAERSISSWIAVVVATVVTTVAQCIAAAAEPEYALQTAVSKSVRAVYEFGIDAPDFAAREWILFAAQAPELPGQSNVRGKFSPQAETYRDLSDLHRRLWRARVPADDDALRHAVTGRVELEAVLHSRHLVRRREETEYTPPREPSEAMLQAALRESKLIDFSADDFQAWLKENRLHKKQRESDLDFGRRTFLAITQAMEYDYGEKMDRRASHLCRDDRTDCGGMCVLFVAALRAGGVPARVLLGRWAKSADVHGKLNGVDYRQQHVKAEFYARGVGWVPVDLSSAVLHDDTDEGLRYFGHDAGDFITFHVDPDLTVDTLLFGEKSFPLLQGFHYWAAGRGKLDTATYRQTWTVEKLSDGSPERR